MMPVMNGSEFLEAMRNDAALRDIPVVILRPGRENGPGNRLAWISAGKPVDTTLLLDLVTRYCSGGRRAVTRCCVRAIANPVHGTDQLA